MFKNILHIFLWWSNLASTCPHPVGRHCTHPQCPPWAWPNSTDGLCIPPWDGITHGVLEELGRGVSKDWTLYAHNGRQGWGLWQKLAGMVASEQEMQASEDSEGGTFNCWAA